MSGYYYAGLLFNVSSHQRFGSRRRRRQRAEGGGGRAREGKSAENHGRLRTFDVWARD